MRAGTHAVLRSQETLDRINVFPVADADTGANLVATLTAATSALGDGSPAAIGSAARLVADAALAGARGNSGAIFAQFLDGLAGGLETKNEVGTREFARAATAGADAAYLAVLHPREGTILTVLRAWALEMTLRASHLHDFRELLDRALSAARTALAGTPDQLEVLRRNKVVDAGGQGLVYFLEGWMGTWEGEMLGARLIVAESPLPDAYRPLVTVSGATLRAYRAVSPGATVTVDVGLGTVAAAEADSDEPRYCAQVLLEGQGLDRAAVQSALVGMGRSLVVAGGAKRMSVHLHTSDPPAFRVVMEEFGTVETFRVDDLVEQRAAGLAAPIALVVDSTCDLSEAAQLRLGTVMVPLTMSVAGREYLDRVELGAGEFYDLARGSDVLPRSSQPNRVDFRKVYEALLEEHEAVVSVHLSSRLSGTYHAASTAAKDVDEDRIKVIDSCHVSVGMGLVVEAAGEAIRAGEGLDRVVAIAEAAAADTRVYGATPSLEFAVKGGRVSGRSARVADFLRLKPIILFDGEGGAHVGGIHVGFDRALRGLADRSIKFADGGPARLAVTHADAPAAAEYVLRQLRRHFVDDDIPLLESGSVLATHTGLGAVAVAVRRLVRSTPGFAIIRSM